MLVLDQRDTQMALTGLAEADARGDRDVGPAQQQLANSSKPMSRCGAGPTTSWFRKHHSQQVRLKCGMPRELE